MKMTTRRWIAVLAATLAVSAVAVGAQEMPMHHRGHHAEMDPALMDKHIDLMVEHLLKDGTADQKAKVAAIAKAAMADLRPLRQQLQANHRQALDILGQPTVDRAALEQVRAAQVQLMDSVSRRVMTAVADASDLLTPEQRKRFANHLHQMHGH
ncbi:MAG TPA: periplasmic heavy metal sensor [Telluria sp.]|nr:periplasmic heavy metal sensor [Telluria sp.]